MKNQFIIDLEVIDLTDAQRVSIESALHKAVSSELARFVLGKNVTLVPLETKGTGDRPGGPLGFVGKF